MPNIDKTRNELRGGEGDDIPPAERLLLDIIDTVREPLLVLDPDFRVANANRAFFRMFRVEPADTLGELLFALGDGQWDIAPLRELLRDKLPGQPHLDDFEVDHTFPGVGRKIMLLNARSTMHGPGASRIILLAFEDITERRLTERRLAAHGVELQRSNIALDEFAAVASHDLQEPLRKIVSFGERLETSAGAALDANSRHYLDRMLNAAGRMRKLIADILAYSQVATKVEPFARTDLGTIAREVVADLGPAMADVGGRIEVGALPVIDADAPQMRQLLQNLLTNALKYHRKDIAPIVHLGAEKPTGAFCTITVADNGIGFNDEHAEKIFSMFARLHGRSVYDGSGIGLAICRRIVERHRGTIAATGIPGQGATFTITLPITHAATGLR